MIKITAFGPMEFWGKLKSQIEIWDKKDSKFLAGVRFFGESHLLRTASHPQNMSKIKIAITKNNKTIELVGWCLARETITPNDIEIEGPSFSSPRLKLNSEKTEANSESFQITFKIIGGAHG